MALRSLAFAFAALTMLWTVSPCVADAQQRAPLRDLSSEGPTGAPMRLVLNSPPPFTLVVSDLSRTLRTTCSGTCQSALSPGRYEVQLLQSNGLAVEPRARVDLKIPSQIDGHVDSYRAGRIGGRVMLGTLPVSLGLVVVGFIVKSLAKDTCTDYCDTPPDPADRPRGIRMIVAGSALTAALASVGGWLLSRQDRARITSHGLFAGGWKTGDASSRGRDDTTQLAAVQDRIRTCKEHTQPLPFQVGIASSGRVSRVDTLGSTAERACFWQILKTLRFAPGSPRVVSFTY